MSNTLVQLFPKDWLKAIGEEQTINQLEKIEEKIFCKNKPVFPEKKDIFNAFKYTSFKNTQVVILGQDPYHGMGQAHGLAFSVQDGCKFPPSLKNIFKELESDIGVQIPMSGNLSYLAKQGVLLLNTVLTVEQSLANSHQKKGWEEFTDEIIKTISEKRKDVVFVLWGAPARKKINLINLDKHLVIQSAHPSPLSSYRGFFGSRPFSQIDGFLEEKGQNKIKWESAE